MDMVFWSLEQRIDVLRNAVQDSVWGLQVTQDTLEITICDACTAHGMSQNVVGARYADTVRATELIETAYASFHDYLHRIASLDVEFRDAEEGCFPALLGELGKGSIIYVAEQEDRLRSLQYAFDRDEPTIKMWNLFIDRFGLIFSRTLSKLAYQLRTLMASVTGGEISPSARQLL